MTSDLEMRGKEALRDPAVAAAAIDWFVRQQADDMPGDDWLAFSEWLGQDPRHVAAFDAVVAADGQLDRLDLAALGATPVAANDDAPLRRMRRIGAPLAAALVVVLVIFGWPRTAQPQFETLATRAGETRSLELGETIRIDVAGATELSYRGGDKPVVQLAHGEAAFFIDSPQPSALRVEVGGLTLTDKGTTFDVISDAYGTRIAVGKGLVAIDSDDARTEVGAGQRFVLSPDGTSTLSDFPAAEMAGWRGGQLAFREAPLGMVASDLGRALGYDISVAPGLDATRFTGSIPLAGDPAVVVSRAAALMGAAALPKDGGWEIRPR